MLVLLALFQYGGPYARAQAPVKGECLFLGVKKTDRIGEDSAYPDDKPDAVFALNLRPTPGDSTVSAIEIKAVSGARGLWKAGDATPAAKYMAVARAQSPSDIINRSPGDLTVNPAITSNLLLFISDDGHFENPNRQYMVKVVYADGVSWTAKVKRAKGDSTQAPSPSTASYPLRMSATLMGISRYDAVGKGPRIRGDNKADGLFQLTIQAAKRRITAIQIRSVSGPEAVWDTVPGTPSPKIGVALSSNPTRLLNNRDGSVILNIDNRTEFNLYVADNGAIKSGESTFRLTVTFANNEVAWCPVESGKQRPSREQTPPSASGKRVNFLATWLGYVSTDAVGPYPGVKPDTKADAVFGLDIEIKPSGVIRGVEILSMSDPSLKWSTGGLPNPGWGLGVSYQSDPQKLLNRSDGSILAPVEKRTRFYLYAADPGNMPSLYGKLKLVVYLEEGGAYQQMVRKPTGATTSIVPGQTGEKQAMGLITSEFRGFIADLVNTSTRPGKDGYLDGTFITKLKVSEKEITEVSIKDSSGVIRWSSQGKLPAWFLGVAVYPKIYDLVNSSGGEMDIPVSERRTLYLYAADNGLLSDPKSRLTVVVTFKDESVLSTEVIK
jgi:hypothetical protein